MELVTLRSFDNYFLGNLMLGKMQNAGIESYLYNETGVTLFPLGGNSIGGVKLVVKKDDYDEALKLMEQFDEEYIRSVKCPKCGAHDFKLVIKKFEPDIFTNLLNKLFSSNTLDVQHVYYCENCGYECDDLPYPEE